MIQDRWSSHAERLVSLSTRHLTKQDADLLNEDVGEPDIRIFPGIVVPYEEYGWLLWIPSDIHSKENFQLLTEMGFSGAFIYLLSVLCNEGVQRVLIDRDAMPHPDFVTFDW